jgi:hypothetical protein
LGNIQGKGEKDFHIKKELKKGIIECEDENNNELI